MFSQPVDNGFQVERSLADPVGQDCAVQINARTGEAYGQAVPATTTMLPGAMSA